MARAVKLSEELVLQATTRAKAMSRSTAGQIEYWAKIGRIAEENPDLSYAFIKDILIGLAENKAKQTEEYQFSSEDNKREK